MENYHETIEKQRIGLIGFPITHSFSPKMFYDSFMDCQDVLDRYSYDLIETSDFEEAMSMFMEHYYAINVTQPFKELAFRAADQKSNTCRWVGATNLLVKENGGIKAYNTDYFAVFDMLKNEIPHEKATDTKALVIGCGGAGMAATAACLKLGLDTTLLNRDLEKAEDYRDYLEENAPEGTRMLSDTVGLEDLAKAVKAADVIIYALPVALDNLGDIDFSGKLVIEANYRDPAFTTEIKNKTGMRYIGGTEWLRLQAEATYRIIIF